VALSDERLLGYEALIRWQHPTRGLLPPAAFLSAAEDNRLTSRLGAWVLHQACEQAQAWRGMGLPPLDMAVNVSAIDFRQHDFVDNLAAILKQTGLPPAWLELEITENVLMQNVDDTVQILQTIKAMGVRLALDDFGTGYSSLSYLRRFPIDVLKIDQSFVRGLNENNQDAQLISAIIGMGKSLELNIIAEGVETVEQLNFLKSQQCEEGQGFLFSKAVPPKDFARLLQVGSATLMPAQ